MQGRTNTRSKVSASFIVVEEGFQLFCNDLNKLQVNIPLINRLTRLTRQWDKTSKSRFKELYLSRAVEVQPCFNRDVISDLSDQATTSIQELTAWAEGENIRYEPNRPIEYTVTGQAVSVDNDDIDAQFLQAAINSNISTLQDWITRLLTPPDAKDRFTRIFLAAIPDASETSLALLLSSGLVDIQAEDEVNERNCLHEAAISGNQAALQIGFAHRIDVSRPDVYGRIPLHYACIMGRVAMVQQLLRLNPRTINESDHDKFTPLIHAIAHNQLDCVQELLKYGACLDPENESDHVPLNLACQYGRTAIVKLLLEQTAKLLPDAEGLYPQHLVARSGQNPETLLLLEKYGADLDQRDKFYQWTPLFHAASEGQVDCIQVLVDQGVDTTILDEKGCSAMYYAAWEGHLGCMRLLNLEEESTDGPQPRLRQTSSLPLSEDIIAEPTGGDGIPDLSLPPPIIPLRRYGHNFLDNKTFIQLSFETTGSDAIIFYHDSKYPAARLTISSKSCDVIPRNIMLPIQEDARVVPFQIDVLGSFSIDFDIYPTFGSKVIARSVALPALFTAQAHSSGSCCLPLFDLRLRPIGQISFAFQVIKPFQSMPLDVTTFATYWRATSQIDSHPNGFITGSSLSGNYVQLFVQVTGDGIPVLYSKWCVDHQGLDVPISRLRFGQYSNLGLRDINQDELLASIARKTPEDNIEIHHLLASSFASLKDVLSHLPTSIHLEIRVLFPTASQEQELGLSPSPNINNFVDAILKAVFEHTRITREQTPDFVRSIVFSSYNPDICTALNWKQPNCIVGS
ncbi:uncharacterized protein KY384_007012 [Bacidia gigantensis]|uniref:uncharacterized protein n=1 Tax=Bacidia gigantensis TaxID=2732470 RepID=UPI001D0574CD|nr:uncharacterized protein KY384_007012 [Bacidia gigantensis]KAG8528096.1 hypothetical protein KY384_007012 [Bacidia gigantensis]